MVKEGLLYTKDHEWAKVEDDIAIIGISDHAQDMLGELTYVELPEIGKIVEKGKELAMLESSKSASDVFSPVTGEVEEVNSDLLDTPEQVNNDCYGLGWICKIKLTDKISLDGLIDSDQYSKFLEQ